MAQIINTNIMSLNAQRNLNTSGASLATTIQRLSSGLRINSAKDDAAGLAISERFSTQIRGMDQAARNANDGISLAQTAEGALGEISNNLQRIRDLAVQSRNATNSASDRLALDAEVQLLKAEVQRVAEQTNFNGTTLLNGSFQNQAFQVGADQGQVINIAQIANANIKDLGNWNRVATPATAGGIAAIATGTAQVTGTAPAMSLVGATTTPGSGALTTTQLGAPADTNSDGSKWDYAGFTLDVGGTAVAIGAATGASEADARTALLSNIQTAVTAAGISGLSIDASVAGTLQFANSGSTALTIDSASASFPATVNITAQSATAGTPTYGVLTSGQLTINGVEISSAGAAGTASDGVDALVTQFNLLKADPANTTLANVSASNVNGTLQLTDGNGEPVRIGGSNPAAAGLRAGTSFPAGSFTITGSSGTATINFPAAGGSGQRAADMVKAINNQSYNTGVTASLDTDGNLSLASLGGNFSIGPAANGTPESLLATTGLTAGLTGAMDPTQTPPAATIGSGWLAGEPETGFEDLNITDATGADNALNAMDAALQAINSARADLGAIQNRFTSTIANLNTSSENLSAARSRIRDADYAKETAELTRTQILQQAGTAMLAQANQSPQNVLSLLK